MARYKLEYIVVFHPRPLQCGVWVGKRKEAPAFITFEANNDGEAEYSMSQILDPYPKLPKTPNRTVHVLKLAEVRRENREFKEIRVVKTWKKPHFVH